jgi:hypothetical protein
LAATKGGKGLITTETLIKYVYGDEIKVKPISDVHLGAVACDEFAFKKYLADSDDKTYFIGVGDLLDLVVWLDFKRYRPSQNKADHSEDDVIDQWIERAVKILDPYKERILGLGEGNHEDAITKHHGTNPMKRICEALHVPFLGYSWLFKLNFREETGRGRTVVIRGHHGWGGGSRTQGADLTKFSRDVAYYDADLFLYGHVHQKQHDEVPRLGLSGNRLIAKPKIMVLCGTFLKTLSDNHNPTYSESKGYPPVSIGGPTIHIKPNRDWVDMKVTL